MPEKKHDKTETEVVAQLRAEKDQAVRENEALQHRITQLASFETEVRDLRTQVTDKDAAIAEALQARDDAVRDAATARNVATNATSQAGSDASVVAAAQGLVAALKVLQKS